MLSDILGSDRAQLYAHPERSVPAEAAAQFEAMVTRRVEGEPLQHILGYASFYGLEFQVSPAVMIPRPETERVVDRVLAFIEGREAPRVLDVGTGSGCIALTIKHERPDAEVHACDVSPDALAVARSNAEALGLDVQFWDVDVTALDASQRLPAEVDVLVSNPPYIPEAEADTLPPVVRDYDPDIALFSGEDPLHFYRLLTDLSQPLCTPGGHVVVEVHAEYATETAALMREAGLVGVSVEDDLSGRPRIVRGRRPDHGEESFTSG